MCHPLLYIVFTAIFQILTMPVQGEIRYKLYTRTSDGVYTEDYLMLSPYYTTILNLNYTDFSNLRSTVIFSPGYGGTIYSSSTVTLRNEYLKSGLYNFIVVDWSDLNQAPDYVGAVYNTKPTGKDLARLIVALGDVGVPASSIHLIGFSLGAHVVGFAGKHLQSYGAIVGRITGLDPAKPGFEHYACDERLDRSDALFVDVIHTDVEMFGMSEAIGDVDFYPNVSPGVPQPGCWLHEQLNHVRGYETACSHHRSWRFYAESISNPKGFAATKCKNWFYNSVPCCFSVDGYMGFGAQSEMRGRMYLKTNADTPYAKNDYY